MRAGILGWLQSAGAADGVMMVPAEWWCPFPLGRVRITPLTCARPLPDLAGLPVSCSHLNLQPLNYTLCPWRTRSLSPFPHLLSALNRGTVIYITGAEKILPEWKARIEEADESDREMRVKGGQG